MGRPENALLLLALAGLLLVAAGYESFSDEDDPVPTYEVVVPEGKQLRLRVFNYDSRDSDLPRWYHNDLHVTEWRCQSNRAELLCPAVSPLDAGRYEMWGSTKGRTDRRRLIFSAYVRVTTNKEAHRMAEPVTPVPEPHPATYGERDDCFCSGITGVCRMPDDLYRSKVSFNLSSAESIDQYDSSAESAAVKVLAIPATVWSGNLITAYGGYLRFPLTDECYVHRSKPCVVFIDRRGVGIGYFLPPRHDQREVSVLMHESSWRRIGQPHVDTAFELRESQLDKFTFLSVLSNIRTVYIRGRYKQSQATLLTLDLASPYDEGLGKVGTVEQCYCHEGYAGLSCERCEKGYVRWYGAINPTGLCITEYELWKLYKRKYNTTLDLTRSMKSADLA